MVRADLVEVDLRVFRLLLHVMASLDKCFVVE